MQKAAGMFVAITWIRVQLLLVPVLALVTWGEHAMAQDDSAPSPVRVGPVVVRNSAAAKTFVGTIEPARRSVVGADVAGKVQTVLVEEGDLVDPGSEDSAAASGALIRLRDDAVRIQLAAAEAELEVARQNLAELQAGTRPEELKRLKAGVSAAESLFQYASKRAGQIQTLFDRGATEEGALDEALSARFAAEQTLIGAQAEYEAAVNGARPEALARGRALQAVAQQAVNRLQDQLQRHTVYAPFRGYVGRRYVENGAWVAEGDPVAEIVEVDEVEVRIAVPEDDISRIIPGMSVRVDVAAVADLGNRADVLTGEVYRVVPDGDVRSRSFPVRIRLRNREHLGQPLLKPGMLAKVVLLVGEQQPAIMIEKDALVLEGRSAKVFVVDDVSGTRRVREVSVRLGGAMDTEIQVLPESQESLRDGMNVVTEGNERLEHGQVVTIIE